MKKIIKFTLALIIFIFVLFIFKFNFLNINNNSINNNQLIMKDIINNQNLSEFSKHIVNIKIESDSNTYKYTNGIVFDDENNYIITTASCFKNLKNSNIIVISFFNNKKSFAKLVGIDINNNIAILTSNKKLFNKNYYKFNFDYKIGDDIYLINNNYNSLLNAKIGKIKNVSSINLNNIIQYNIITDLNINNDDIGSAILNKNGEIIAILNNYNNQYIITPMKALMPLIEQLIDYGYTEKNILEIDVQDYIDNNKNINQEFIKGVIITNVYNNQKPFFSEGDIIVTVNEQKINNITDYYESINYLKSNKKINVGIIRDNKYKNIYTNTININSIKNLLEKLSMKEINIYHPNIGNRKLVEIIKTANINNLNEGDIIMQIEKYNINSVKDALYAFKYCIDSHIKTIKIKILDKNLNIEYKNIHI